MKKDRYLFDTHALVFWNKKISVSDEFVKFFDQQELKGRLYISSISFWEIAFLVKKNRLVIPDIHAWKNELLSNANLRLLEPSPTEMINSTLLPDYHKDPFDRLLIAQVQHHKMFLVTRDQAIQRYDVPIYWM